MTPSPLQGSIGAHGDQQLTETVEQPLARICCYCRPHHVMSEGSLPASHGLCDRALAEQMAAIDRIEAGRAIADPVAVQVGLGVAAALECLTGIGGLLGAKRQEGLR